MCLCAAVVFIFAYISEARITFLYIYQTGCGSSTFVEQLVYICGTLYLIRDCFLMSPNVKHILGGSRSRERDPNVFVIYGLLIVCMH